LVPFAARAFRVPALECPQTAAALEQAGVGIRGNPKPTAYVTEAARLVGIHPTRKTVAHGHEAARAAPEHSGHHLHDVSTRQERFALLLEQLWKDDGCRTAVFEPLEQVASPSPTRGLS
jgi:hypothetical protein